MTNDTTEPSATGHSAQFNAINNPFRSSQSTTQGAAVATLAVRENSLPSLRATTPGAHPDDADSTLDDEAVKEAGSSPISLPCNPAERAESSSPDMSPSRPAAPSDDENLLFFREESTVPDPVAHKNLKRKCQPGVGTRDGPGSSQPATLPPESRVRTAKTVTAPRTLARLVSKSHLSRPCCLRCSKLYASKPGIVCLKEKGKACVACATKKKKCVKVSSSSPSGY